jgi:hypothetical protein
LVQEDITPEASTGDMAKKMRDGLKNFIVITGLKRLEISENADENYDNDLQAAINI